MDAASYPLKIDNRNLTKSKIFHNQILNLDFRFSAKICFKQDRRIRPPPEASRRDLAIIFALQK
jgi:hypothetical protein